MFQGKKPNPPKGIPVKPKKGEKLTRAKRLKKRQKMLDKMGRMPAEVKPEVRVKVQEIIDLVTPTLDTNAQDETNVALFAQACKALREVNRVEVEAKRKKK